jgi:hypothetical protein
MSQDAPLCRWTHHRTILDVMPLDEKILGLANRWYKAAMESSATIRLSNDLEIRVVTAPYFVATKLEAFKGRGRETSLEATIWRIWSRSSTAGKPWQPKSGRIRTSSARTFGLRLRANSLRLFSRCPPGYLLPGAASQSRISLVLSRLEDLASMRERS